LRREEVIVENNVSVKPYRKLGKKGYPKGKYVYEHERIYVPIPANSVIWLSLS